MKRSRQQSVWTRMQSLPRTAAMSLLVVIAMFMGAGIDRILLEVGSASDRFSSASNYSVLGETYEAIRENYVLQDQFTDEQLVWGAATGMVEALGDTNHSAFLNPEQAKQWEQSANNELIGIGISVNTQSRLPIVIYPMKDSPAMKAGIQPGDTILEIDGVDVSTMPASEAVDLIRGEEGTDVVIKLRHQNEEEPYEVTITRAFISVDPASYTMLPNNVLWLKLDGFSRGASKRVAQGLEWGKEQGMTGVIFDLRGNGGGYVVEALGVASQFLPDSTPLYQETDITGAKRVVRTVGNKGAYLEGPLVVLIDENSASASELTSSALKENGRAELVGKTTAGTGTVLLPFELSDGSVAILGTSLFLTGQGADIYHKGVDPNHDVEFSPLQYQFPLKPDVLDVDKQSMDQQMWDNLEDPQLKFAMDLLQK